MPITRRDFIKTVGATGATAWASTTLGTAARAAGKERKMNVLMILVDDMRPQLSCYGHAEMVTPNLDRLASQGTLFDRHYCPQAICAPSRIALLSGCRPDTTGIYDLETMLHSKHPEILSLPRHFKNLGYTTISQGKFYHHRKDDPDAWSHPATAYAGIAKGRGYVLPENVALLEKIKSDRGPAFERADVPDNAYADGALADAGVAMLAELKDRPFFLGIGFHKPHLPFCAPAKYWDLYDLEKIALPTHHVRPKDAPEIAMHDFGELRNYHGIPPKGPIDPKMARQLIHGYYAGVSYTDSQIGRVLDELERTGLADNTLVVFTADHGWLLGEHGLWCKHCNFEEACRVPLIIRMPGGKAGQRTAALTEHNDLYSTVCELAGAPTPKHVEGISLAPLLDDPDRSWKSAAFSQYPRRKTMGYSMRTDRYRFTRWGTDAEAPIELYDYQTDPAGAVNAAHDPKNADLIRDFSAQLSAGWKQSLPA